MELRGIYGITSRAFGQSHAESAMIFLNGGVRIIQYREKEAPFRVREHEANQIKELCRSYGAKFIINDSLDLALSVGADGLHVGRDDVRLDVVSRVFRGEIVGASASNQKEALMADGDGATYLGVGTIYPTSTKTDGDIIGVEGLKEIRRSTGLPIFAIGGIKLENLKEVWEAGADGVALISAILGADNPVETARKFVKSWDDLSRN